MNPRVSVLMPVFNGEKYLLQSIESMLRQTYENFEFMIVDDASTDGSRAIVQACRDERIRLVCNERNIGVAQSLNRAWDMAQGKYVARMDSDDVSLPQRLEKQVRWMEQNPHVAACGTWALDIDAAGKILRTHPVPSGWRLHIYYWRPSPIIHPTAMMRNDSGAKWRYDPSLVCAQDYDLWLRMRRESELGNIDEPLLHYRVHADSVTAKKAHEQLATGFRIFDAVIGNGQVSLEDYKALSFLSLHLHPLRRALATRKVARLIGQRYGYLFWRDDVSYALRWFRHRPSKTARPEAMP